MWRSTSTHFHLSFWDCCQVWWVLASHHNLPLQNLINNFFYGNFPWNLNWQSHIWQILNTLMKPNIDSYVVITVHIFFFITLYNVYMRWIVRPRSTCILIFCVSRSAFGWRSAVPVVPPGADGGLHDLPVHLRRLCLSDCLLPGHYRQQ